MRRRIFSILTAASTLILAIASIAWLRSISSVDRVEFTLSGRRIAIESASHRLHLHGAFSLESSPTIAGRIGHDAASPDRTHLLPSYQETLFTRSLSIPYWLIVLPASLLPFRTLLRRLRRSRNVHPRRHHRNKPFRRA